MQFLIDYVRYFLLKGQGDDFIAKKGFLYSSSLYEQIPIVGRKFLNIVFIAVIVVTAAVFCTYLSPAAW